MSKKSPILAGRPSANSSSAKDRVLAAAYTMFCANSVDSVGIDSIIAAANVAKMSFYKHFASKEELVLAFLRMHDELWREAWLQGEIHRRAKAPRERLLAIFDAYDSWIHSSDFTGCPFIRTVLDSSSPRIRASAAQKLQSVTDMVRALAVDAGLGQPDRFTAAWTSLMKGAVVTAVEGNRNAARSAKQAAVLILERWPQAGQRAARR